MRNSLEVSIISPEGMVFEGSAERVILPGEQGVFEVLPHHKPLLSRLLTGQIEVDDHHRFRIRRGIVKVGLESVWMIVETQ